MKPAIIFALGVIITAAGVLFALQGASVVRWPADSFMIGTRDWIEYGIAIGMVGLGLMLAARRMRQGK